MAPSVPLVAVLFRLSNADLDEASMLQMPVVEKIVETDDSDCRCPGFFEQDCRDNAYQGCIWTDAGASDSPWCQCDPDFVGTPPIYDAPPAPPAPAPIIIIDPVIEDTDDGVDRQAPAAACPAGWEQKGEIGADIGGCGLQSCGDRYDITSEAACATRCDGNSACVGFSYAPMNGDRNHPGVTACTIYNSDAPTGTWTGTEGVPTQVFCGRAPVAHVVEVTGPWTLVLQYGTEPSAKNSGAVGTPSESETGAAKLSDADINALPSGHGAYSYYRLTSDSQTAGVQDAMLLRSTGVYDDMASGLGLEGDWAICLDSTTSVAECTNWWTGNVNNRIDTISQHGNDCDRWFTGYNGIFCFGANGAGHTYDNHCWSHGNACPLGAHAIRTNLKMYKCTMEDC